jgi:hypothetical protein
MVIEMIEVAALLIRTGTIEVASLTEGERIGKVLTMTAVPRWTRYSANIPDVLKASSIFSRLETSEYLRDPHRPRFFLSPHRPAHAQCRLQMFHDQGRATLVLRAAIGIATTRPR